jgi:2'-5' RNA ligase
VAHSVELLLDPDTDQAVRRVWQDLAEAGLPSQAAHRAPSNRPHVTMTVAAAIDGAVDAELSDVAAALPVPCRLGAPLVFGRGPFILTRLVVPSAGLLDLHAQVHRICLLHMPSGPFAHAAPGSWTPHVTVARRLDGAALERAVALAGGPTLDGAFVGLRRWDGDARTEFALG